MCRLKGLTVLMSALGLAFIPILAVAPPPASAATAYRIKVVNFNISGRDNGGAVAAINKVSSLIGDYNPDVVLLQEVCQSQYQALQNRHPGWQFQLSIEKADALQCGNDAGVTPFGMVIMSRHPMRTLPDVVLPKPGDVSPTRRISLGCAHVQLPGHAADALRACTTHLTTGNEQRHADARRAQTIRIRDSLAPAMSREAMVLTGDFNAGPQKGEMNHIYRLTNNNNLTGPGDFHEADQVDEQWFKNARPPTVCGAQRCRSGQWTLKNHAGQWAHKVDYIFFSANAAPSNPQPDPLNELYERIFYASTSGHTPMLGRVTLRMSR